MNDKERRNAIISAISDKESRLVKLDQRAVHDLYRIRRREEGNTSHISIDMQTIIRIISSYAWN